MPLAYKESQIPVGTHSFNSQVEKMKREGACAIAGCELGTQKRHHYNITLLKI